MVLVFPNACFNFRVKRQNKNFRAATLTNASKLKQQATTGSELARLPRPWKSNTQCHTWVDALSNLIRLPFHANKNTLSPDPTNTERTSVISLLSMQGNGNTIKIPGGGGTITHIPPSQNKPRISLVCFGCLTRPALPHVTHKLILGGVLRLGTLGQFRKALFFSKAILSPKYNKHEVWPKEQQNSLLDRRLAGCLSRLSVMETAGCPAQGTAGSQGTGRLASNVERRSPSCFA